MVINSPSVIVNLPIASQMVVNESTAAASAPEALPATSPSSPYAYMASTSYDEAKGAKKLEFIAAYDGKRFAKLTLEEDGLSEAESEAFDAFPGIAAALGDKTFKTRRQYADGVIAALKGLLDLTIEQYKDA